MSKEQTYLNWNRGFLQKLGGSISKDVVSPFGEVGDGFGGSSLSSMIPSSDPKFKRIDHIYFTMGFFQILSRNYSPLKCPFFQNWEKAPFIYPPEIISASLGYQKIHSKISLLKISDHFDIHPISFIWEYGIFQKSFPIVYQGLSSFNNLVPRAHLLSYIKNAENALGTRLVI